VSAPQSTQQRCILAVQAAVQGFGLAGLPAEQVVAGKLPLDRNLTLPAVVCSLPADAGEELPGGFNQREDVGYPVQVTILGAENQDNDLNDQSDQLLLWRQDLLLHFHNLRLAGVSEVIYCKVEPRAIVDVAAFLERNLLAGGFVVRCYARQARD
jgi:hypothetical protein